MAGVRRGSHELAVLRELKALKVDTSAGHRDTSTELVLTLARSLDSSPPLPLVVKLADLLHKQMRQIRELVRERDGGAAERDLSTPVWHAAQSGAADVGAEGGGGGAAAG